MKRKFSYLLPFLFSTILLTSCNLAPPLRKPDLEVPCTWQVAQNSKKSSNQFQKLNWWTAYNEPYLNELIEEALNHNDEVWLAAAHVEEARGLSLGAYANRFPNTQLDIEASRTSLSNQSPLTFGIPNPYNDFSITGLLSFELDLWGRLANANKAACANLFSKEYNQYTVCLAIASEVANNYFSIAALNEQIVITEETIRTRNEALELQQKRFNRGDIDELVLKQAQADVSSAQASLPTFMQQRDIFLHSLSILLGRSPKELVDGLEANRLMAIRLPNTASLPEVNATDCILTRPDIMAAEETLIAANANIGIARANYFPTLSLSAFLGLNSNTVSSLFNANANTWEIGGSLVGPLIDFGRTRSKVEIAQAQENQAYINYARTVRTAFGEVADTLTIRQMTTERLQIQTTLVNTYKDSLRLSRLRFNNGYVSYLEVVDAERNLFVAQLDHVDTKRNQLQASVNLYKALGGPCL